MDPDLTEITPEERLEVASGCCIKRLTWRAEHLIHAGWSLAEGFLAGRALSADLRARVRIRDRGSGRARDLIGDPVRLTLKRVINGADYDMP
jgi:hypothetical protein